jgi:hypothetical protein
MWNLSNVGKVSVSLIVTFGFLGVTWLLLTTKLEGSATPEVLLMLVGTLAAKFGDVVAYWIGSSQSSSTKDAAINEIATKNTGTGGGTGAGS